MASYLVLGNWTEQGIRNIKESPQRVEAAKQAIQAAGGRMIFFYVTMGQYDFATLVELPNDEITARVLLTIARQGNMRSITLKAFTEEEFQGVVGSLP